MKHPFHLLILLLTLGVLVLFSAGLAFAHGVNNVQKFVNNYGTLRVVESSDYSPLKLLTSMLKRTEDNASLVNDPNVEPNSAFTSLVGPSPSSPFSTEDFSISFTNTITSFEDEMELTGIVESIMTDTWKVAGQVFAVNADTEIEGTIVVGDKVKVELYLDQAKVLTASQIELLSEDEDQVTLEFTGTVTAVSPGMVTVSGHDLVINDETEIEGKLIIGAMVKVEALVNPGGALIALQIELLEKDGDEDDSDDGDCEEIDNEDDDEDGDVHQGQSQLICGISHDDDHDGSQDAHPSDFDGDEEEGDD